MRTAAAATLAVSLLYGCSFDASGREGPLGAPDGAIEGVDASVATDATAAPGPDAVPDARPESGADAAVAADAAVSPADASRPDASRPPDASPPADAREDLRAYGETCQTDAECETGVCERLRGNDVCTLACSTDQDCPDDDPCRSGGLCVPGGD